MQKYSHAEIIMSRKYQEFQEANPWIQVDFSKPVPPEEFIPGESYIWVHDILYLDLYDDAKSHVDYDIQKVVFEDSPSVSNHKNNYFFRKDDGKITVRRESHGKITDDSNLLAAMIQELVVLYKYTEDTPV